MNTIKTTAILTAVATLLFATDGYADDREEAAQIDPTPKTKIIKVKASVPMDKDLFLPVEAKDGTIYYNRYMPTEDLTEVETEFETVDKVTVKYDGRRFTNRIVKASS